MVEPAVEVAAANVTVETLDFGRDSFLLLCRLHAMHHFRLLVGSPARLIGAPRERAVEQAEQHRWQTFGFQQAEQYRWQTFALQQAEEHRRRGSCGLLAALLQRDHSGPLSNHQVAQQTS